MTLTVAVVDDEPLAREGVMNFLAAHDDVDVVAECRTGREMVDAVRLHAPDIVFLDIQMPEMDGFAALAMLDPDDVPVVVFVTAYDEYALEAFRVHAVDYVLKPTDAARLDAALAHAREQVGLRRQGDVDEKVRRLLVELRPRSSYLDRIMIKARGRIYFVKADQIDWVEAAGNYARLHVGADRHVMRETMTRLESQLDPELFMRIHRSYIVNVERIQEIRPLDQGEYLVLLTTGKQLTLSRTYRDRLQHRMGRAL